MTNEPDIFDTSTAADLSDAAIEAALREMNHPTYRVDNVRKYPEHNRHFIVLGRVIQRHYPEKMEDPDLDVVREIVAGQYEEAGSAESARQIRSRMWDGVPAVAAALAAYKAGKEAGK